MAERLDFEGGIDQGATFDRTFQVMQQNGSSPVDLTGCNARMHFRNLSSDKELMALSTENGRIIITPELGEIQILLSHEDTSAMEVCLDCVYDFDLLWPGTRIDRLFSGRTSINREMARNE